MSDNPLVTSFDAPKPRAPKPKPMSDKRRIVMELAAAMVVTENLTYTTAILSEIVKLADKIIEATPDK